MTNVMKKMLPVTITCWLLPAVCLANGGGYAYGVGLTGTVAPFVPQGTEKIQIVDEKLDILLTPGGARVSVDYVMKSAADKQISVTFGFPVERVKDPYGEPDKSKQLKAPPKHFKGYAVRLEGKPVEATYRTERYRLKGRGKIARSLRRIKGWMVSTISFAPGQRRRMRIQYTSAYDRRGEYVSDDDQAAPSVFRYRLSTGAVWRGPIARGRVTVKALGIHLPWVQIKRPVNRFKRQGAAWTWSFSRLEPTLADDILIHARPRLNRHAVYGDKVIGRRMYYSWNQKVFYLAHPDYRVKASSELPATKTRHYPAANLKRSKKQPWCEGVAGPGVGQSIVIVPTKKLPLHALEILPGHHRSKELFAKNNRPASLEIVLNGTHRFTARLADEPHEHLLVVGGYRKPVKKIEIVIKEVYKGRKYDDTCIALVKLVSRLRREPKHYGAR